MLNYNDTLSFFRAHKIGPDTTLDASEWESLIKAAKAVSGEFAGFVMDCFEPLAYVGSETDWWSNQGVSKWGTNFSSWDEFEAEYPMMDEMISSPDVCIDLNDEGAI
jgi:hypothetical protein